MGGGHRARGPLRAEHRDQAVLRVPQRLRRRAQHQHLPGVPRPARLAARAQHPRRRVRHADRPGPQLRDPAVDLPPQELLLPGHAQGLSGQPVRRPHQRQRLAGAARRQPGADRARPHGGGHRQDVAHRGRGAHPRRRVRARRLQPGRRAVGRDRVRARHPVLGPGAPLRVGVARRPRGHGSVRRSHGGRVHARRRQRVGSAGGHLRARHALRDQEPQLIAIARPGHRVRDRAPDRVARGRRQGGAANSALERGHRGDGPAALEGGGLRLPVLSRARPRARRAGLRVAVGRGGLDRAHAGPSSGQAGRVVRARAGHPAPAPIRSPPWSSTASTGWCSSAPPSARESTPAWPWPAPPTRPPPIPRRPAASTSPPSWPSSAWSRTGS